MPKIVIAPDKFKGSLSAAEAARAMSRGVEKAKLGVQCALCPMADGGEGTVATFLDRGASRTTARVHGPLGAPVEAVYAVTGPTAILEMASASGLALLDPSQRDPTHATTYGTGELIRACMDAGAKHLIVGIGGSATNDAGTGMLRALGVRFLDGSDREIRDSVLDLERLARIDLDKLDERLTSVTIDVAVDVDNPLCGPHGASHTFADQKGATPEQIPQLDAVLEHIADIAAQTLGHDDRNVRGAGAAGGLGFALAAFLGANLRPGVELIARECGLEQMLEDSILCLTGEGKIDEQTVHGKTVYGVARLARKHGVPVIAFGGTVDEEGAKALSAQGIEVVGIAPKAMEAQESMRRAAELLEEAACEAVSRRERNGSD